MLTNHRDEDRHTAAAEASAGVALVPAGRAFERRESVIRAARPDAGFVTHLIATAEQLPQTRQLRRAAPADARSAYSATLQPGAGGATRRVI
ncbi:hypothetical protein ACQR1I_00555 [Bradyrhizobium sp. HKCCYLS2038]|uniref:hypothetical protein n=1 Tax=unclassified Bradyrhizobium TaxID=2631580 RepID=UPI003EC1379A